jgi:phage repressor protein C with HTH and peptisase S24 domain
MKTLQQRFNTAKLSWEEKNHKRFIQADLMRYTGASKGTVSLWFVGNTQTISWEYVRLAAEFFGVNQEWLQSGIGDMVSSTTKAAEPTAEYHTPSKEIVIDQHMDVGGGMGHGVLLRDQPGQITSMKVTGEWLNKNVPSNTGHNNLRVVTGFGNSMTGMFKSGDPLLVDIGVRTLEFDAVYFFRVGDEAFIKILQRVPGQGIKVISKNPDYQTWTINDDMDFEIFARVIKIWNGNDL